MTRFKLTVEYDGAGFVGWQRQDNGFAVQQAIEEAIAMFCGEQAVLHVAGRTDAGVHALGQIAHVDLLGDHPPDTVRDAVNFHLRPHAISILKAEVAAPDFHARFSAVQRAYRNRIVNRRAPLTIERGKAWWVPVALDAGAMAEAARGLLGRHDFSTFRAANCQAESPVKTLDMLEVRRDGDEIVIDARARSFLYHQVRNMAGSLKLAGEGKWSAADLRTALEARDRARGGPTAPAEGLYLVEVVY
jgi:tRNA pseudouridine38-40 synthase